MHAQEAGRHLNELEGRRVGGQGGHLGILYINWAVEGIQHQRCTATKKNPIYVCMDTIDLIFYRERASQPAEISEGNIEEEKWKGG